jgi:asparagine synthase (glutamine-hydrolysing)
MESNRKISHVERVVNLMDPALNQFRNLTPEEACRRLASGDAAALRNLDGAFALVAKEGTRVRLARSMDRPMRYFLAKRSEGPALVVADRIDRIFAWLKSEGLHDQFHPSYTRMVPAHHIVELQLVGCPDPDPEYIRFFAPPRGVRSTDLEELGVAYISAVTAELIRWLQRVPEREPIGVAFSGGIDSGAVFLLTYHAMRKLGLNLARLKAFTLDLGGGEDVAQARAFLQRVDLDLFHEPVEAQANELDVAEALGVLEDYKPLDVQCAAMGLALYRHLRHRYPEWRFMIDGDGGDENLKDYPIEENPELTIRSVVNNSMLYQEGWGVGSLKHSLTYSGGLSRGYVRTYAPARRYGFEGFSPFTRPAVIEVAEAIPFVELTDYDASRLYALKGEIVGRGVKAVTSIELPLFPKRRFQHGALPIERLRQAIPQHEPRYRRQFHAIYE